MQGLCHPDAPCRAWVPTQRPSRRHTHATTRRTSAVSSDSSGRPDAPRQPAAAAAASSSSGGSERTQHCPQAPAPPAQPAPTVWQQQLGAVSRRAAAVLAAAVLTAAATLSPGPLAAPPADAVTQEQLLFLEAWRAVDRAYVDKKFGGQNWFKVREDALKKVPLGSRAETHEAIRTLLASLGDPFTRFLAPDQYNALRRSTVGSVTGVGVEVGFRTEAGSAAALSVISPAPGGPAERAGIRPGDEILDIDGQPTVAMSLYAAGNMLQGVEGSEVVLTIKPGSGGDVKELRLVRQQIAFNPVDSALCSSSGQLAPGDPSGKLGYIRIATFSKQTAEKVRAALTELKQQGAERLVLDVRNNGGGLFPAGVEVGRMLLDRGDIVLIADSTGVRDIYSAERDAIDTTTPLVVLANRGTASASEVLAGALKDNGRAGVAGENTYGKGLIQTIVELSDGSAVAITVAKYQTPAGIDINKVGITPTITLDAATLADIPLSGQGFCRFAQTDVAPKLF